MIKEKRPALNNLSDEEKMILIGELWEEVMTEETFELSDEQKQELDRRIRYAEEHPEDAISWNQVKEKLFKKYNE